MDISNLTIPPELFYSTKTQSGPWKPHHLTKISPNRVARVIRPTSIKKVHGKKTRLNINRTPELGRLGRIKRVLSRKKLNKKKLTVSNENYTKHKHGMVDDHQLLDKENEASHNNNVNSKPLSKQEERIILKEDKDKDEAIKKKMYSVEHPRRKKTRGSSFKFFKTKNERADESSSSDEHDTLLSELCDYSDIHSSPETKRKSPEKVNTSIVIDPMPFEDDDPEINGTTFAIESLLQNLDTTEINDTVAYKQPQETSLDGLIETLEGIPEKEGKVEKKSKKVRFMGLGGNQMQLDAGQKKFGLVECKECGFSYNTNVPEDEKIHNKHHQAVTTIPRFRGWATEDSITIKDWSEHGGRIIHLQPNNKNAKSECVKEIVTQMETEFGIQDDIEQFHVYLAVFDSKIVGIATVKEWVMAKKEDKMSSIHLGIQRLFVRPEFRRKGFACNMLKTIVIMHHKGELLDLKSDVAFSSPTEDGKKLIKSIIGSDDYFTFSK